MKLYIQKSKILHGDEMVFADKAKSASAAERFI